MTKDQKQSPRDKRWDDLAMVEAAKALNSALSLDDVLARFVRLSMAMSQATAATLYLWHEDRQKLCSYATSAGSPEIELDSGEGVAGMVHKTCQPIMVEDAYENPDFKSEVDEDSGFRTRNMLTLPMVHGESDCVGVIQLLNKREGSFDEGDQRRLQVICDFSAVAVERARLHERSLRAAKLETAMGQAAKIQRQFWPKAIPDIPGLTIHLHCQPHSQVGGDAFGLFELADGRLLGMVADVTGKGVPAALLSAALQSALWLEAGNFQGLSSLADRINGLICQFSEGSRFVTAILFTYCADSRELTWVNAGHPPALLINSESEHALSGTSPPFGILPGSPYPESSCRAPEHSRCLIFTDGISEARNGAGEEFGEAGVRKYLQSSPAGEDPADDLLQRLAAFAGDTPADDDVTFVHLTFA